VSPIWQQDGRKKDFHVYIVSNKSMTLYIGITNDLQRRFHEHETKLVPGFTSGYHFDRIVYYETYEDVRAAIAREKQLKGWTRAKKIALVKSSNPEWKHVLPMSTVS
jgi:putative endonuclease